MTPYDFGTVVLVRFPFTDLVGSKKRPVVIVSNQTYNAAMPDVVGMAITSKRPGLGEVLVSDWQAAGLIQPSSIKLVFATLEEGLIERALGVLDTDTKIALRRAILEIFGFGP
jgi:mRNA interferase MazF